MDTNDALVANGHGAEEPAVRQVPVGIRAAMTEDAVRAGGEWEEPAEYAGSVGRTMFDSPTSKDNSITVLLPREHLRRVPSQALVRITSRADGDGRSYLGIVVEGPFAEPDGLRADAPLVVTTSVRGGIFMPKYHGRVQVALLGEEVDGALQPPRFRPLPNSPVFVLGEEETAAVLALGGDLQLGRAVGHQDLPVGIPSDRKGVLPRHTGIIGTTGGGKSTTVAGFIAQVQHAGFATILLDVEGEYTHLNQPTDNPQMLRLLKRQELAPKGVPNTAVYHLLGREPSNPDHPSLTTFGLQFSRLSPYDVGDILGLSEAQQERYWLAYDTTKTLLRRLRIAETDDFALDEFEGGYPGMTLAHLIDVAGCFLDILTGQETSSWRSNLGASAKEVKTAVHAAKGKTNNPISWRTLLARLWRLQRLNVFDNPNARALDYAALLTPGRVSIVDLSDTDAADLRNLVIADILRGVQQGQEANYAKAERSGQAPPKTLVIVEEAHEFLAKNRIKDMENLFAQVARIAKRGRKRWLGLVFVSQLPQHLPDEVLGLINNWVIHKIADANVISTLRRSVGSIDPSLWDRVPSLAPGQAVVSFGHMQRPVLTAVDPAPAKLRMVD